MATNHARASVRASAKRWTGVGVAGLLSREIRRFGVPTSYVSLVCVPMVDAPPAAIGFAAPGGAAGCNRGQCASGSRDAPGTAATADRPADARSRRSGRDRASICQRARPREHESVVAVNVRCLHWDGIRAATWRSPPAEDELSAPADLQGHVGADIAGEFCEGDDPSGGAEEAPGAADDRPGVALDDQ